MYDQQRRNQEQWYSALEQAKDDGMEQGVKQGFEKGIYQVALTMLKDQVDWETVSKYTHLSEAQIQAIALENMV